jgi:hypothetical protein
MKQMSLVFVGGGSFRTLPIVRGFLQNPKVMDGGKIRHQSRGKRRVLLNPFGIT